MQVKWASGERREGPPTGRTAPDTRGTTGGAARPPPPSPRARGWVRTGQDGRAAVLGRVFLPLGHERAVGLCLVGTQRLPLLLQPVLVLQVVLHVGLKGKTRSQRARRARRGIRGPGVGVAPTGVASVSMRVASVGVAWVAQGGAHIAPRARGRELRRRSHSRSPGENTDQPAA